MPNLHIRTYELLNYIADKTCILSIYCGIELIFIFSKKKKNENEAATKKFLGGSVVSKESCLGMLS